MVVVAVVMILVQMAVSLRKQWRSCSAASMMGLMWCAATGPNAFLKAHLRGANGYPKLRSKKVTTNLLRAWASEKVTLTMPERSSGALPVASSMLGSVLSSFCTSSMSCCTLPSLKQISSRASRIWSVLVMLRSMADTLVLITSPNANPSVSGPSSGTRVAPRTKNT